MNATIPPGELRWHARHFRRRLQRALPGSTAADQIGVAAMLLGLLVGEAAFPADPAPSLQLVGLLSHDAARAQQRRQAAGIA